MHVVLYTVIKRGSELPPPPDTKACMVLNIQLSVVEIFVDRGFVALE